MNTQTKTPTAAPIEAPIEVPTEAPSSALVSFGLGGKVAIITGAAQGIGAACAHRFAREGAQVVIADVDDARGTALATELGASYVHCDVGDKAQVDAAVRHTLALHGRIDVLVNNAGIFRAADFLDVSEEDFDAVLRVNLKGAFLMGQAVARVMARASKGQMPVEHASNGANLTHHASHGENLTHHASHGESITNHASNGVIVNMSSVNAVLAIPTISSYNVSKGGINQLTRVMALALADFGIRVNAVAPGTIATELATRAVLTSADARARILSRTPMKRLGQPSEVADVVAWLASEAASYVTGEIVTVDGGRMTLNYTVAV